MKPHDLGGGRTLVKRTENFVYWCAWRWWLTRETGRTVFGEKLCVWGDWPPETLEMAQHVCQSIMAARKRIQFDFPVADPAQPWDRWSAAEREDLERRHREDFGWNPELPKPRSHTRPTIFRTDLQRALDAFIIAEADKKPRVRRGAPLPQIGRIPPRHARSRPSAPAGQEPEPLAFEETPDEVKTARADALQRRLAAIDYYGKAEA